MEDQGIPTLHTAHVVHIRHLKKRIFVFLGSTQYLKMSKTIFQFWESNLPFIYLWNTM